MRKKNRVLGCVLSTWIIQIYPILCRKFTRRNIPSPGFKFRIARNGPPLTLLNEL
ncbi:hypothetical protein B0H19DRAFT_1172304, partial [Mycena capillaripes]